MAEQMKQNVNWKLLSFEFWENTTNKRYEEWKNSKGDIVTKFWLADGEIRVIYYQSKNGNNWAKYFNPSGEIRLEIWRSTKHVSDFLIGGWK